jgi:hypothetical protein
VMAKCGSHACRPLRCSEWLIRWHAHMMWDESVMELQVLSGTLSQNERTPQYPQKGEPLASCGVEIMSW